MELDKNNVEKIPQNEVVLANVADTAIQNLLRDSRPGSYTSKAESTTEGLQVKTFDKDKNLADLIIVNGSNSDSMGPLTYTLTGDYSVKHIKNGQTQSEKDQFVLKNSNYDHMIMGQTDLHNVSLIRTDDAGNVLQSFVPAQTEAVLKDNGDLERAPNGQLLRVTHEIGDDPNHRALSNDKLETEFVLHDPKLGDISINRTRTTESGGDAFSDRMVLRSLDGDVKGIVEMDVKLKGGSGSSATEIQSIETRARPVVLK
ncbi:MAG: hypothetical protein QG574_2711 [Cyanobacteriota bacterium erpe_2018_sw_21hr_WHONDRS-SW48-000092_B_bin.40]|nr:hypothetical protein [Cyanobacteriota bacterium erpe_2018_sw_21hr_WHONDRS-SW48-000092_B_bin.40]